jgi:hypothetical protein
MEKNFLWSMNTPAGCTSKSWCAQEHTIVESFSMPSFLLFRKEKDIYKHQKGQHVGCNANPITNLPHTPGSFDSPPVLGGSLILDQTPTGGLDMVYRQI